MRLAGVGSYPTEYPIGTVTEYTPPASRDTSGANSTRQAGDSVVISPQARAKADEEKVKREVEQLKQDEARVKAHEAAHKAAGGQYAGSVSYSYRQGPDGRSYIVGGEVQIDISPEKTPQETVSKMQVVIRAATAPADPSGQDRAVAAQAASQMAEAQRQQAAEAGGVDSTSSAAVSPPSSDGSRAFDGQDRSSTAGANPGNSQFPFSTYA